jgi:hypothetical protein
VKTIPLELPLPLPASGEEREPPLVWLEEGAPAAARGSETGGETAALTARPPSASRVETTRGQEPVTEPPAGEGEDGEASADEGEDGEAVAADEDELGGASPDAPRAPESAVSEGLTLEQLGVGKNPFLPDLARTIGKKPAPGAGLRRSMANSITKSEQARGLGPEGPVLKELVELTRRSDTALVSNAVLRVTTDAAGRITSVEVVEATSDQEPWRRVASRLFDSLKGLRLRVPRASRGVTMDLKVDSRVALPSGSDPGMGVDVLGLDVKKRGGKRSPRVSIVRIDPKGYKVELPNGKVLELPSMPLQSIVSIEGDPVDIGAKAQRIVHAHLKALWANANQEEEMKPWAPPSASAR